MLTVALRLVDAKWQRTTASEAVRTRMPRERFLSLDGTTYLYLYDGLTPNFRRSQHWTTDGELPLFPIEP